ncbi:MAG: hypothetical protein A2176_04915 [Spirochaetes bacterium RBG_13_51_14]|nr:MAG: hypothetical protein A2176_04915 [Spirochaetes bacterium RBG_13_51_14]
MNNSFFIFIHPPCKALFSIGPWDKIGIIISKKLRLIQYRLKRPNGPYRYWLKPPIGIKPQEQGLKISRAGPKLIKIIFEVYTFPARLKIKQRFA